MWYSSFGILCFNGVANKHAKNFAAALIEIDRSKRPVYKITVGTFTEGSGLEFESFFGNVFKIAQN